MGTLRLKPALSPKRFVMLLILIALSPVFTKALKSGLYFNSKIFCCAVAARLSSSNFLRTLLPVAPGIV
jgi:hypothetical protein